MYARPMQRRDDYATVVTIALLLLLRSLAVALGGPNQYRPESDLPVVWIGPLPQEGARVAAFVCALLALAVFWIVIATRGSAWHCGPPRRTASPCRPPASTSIGSMRSRSPSAWRWPAWRARCWRRCSWCFPPTGGHHSEGLRDSRHRRAGLDPGRADRRRAAGADRVVRRGLRLLGLPEHLRLRPVLLILVLKPNGLFGERGREA